MRKYIKREEGMLVVEATFVYPIMLFVIFFLIYMGNMYYQRSKVEKLVNLEAIRGAAYYADPLLEQIIESGGIPGSKDIDIQPYHYLNLNPSVSIDTMTLANNMANAGFFAGMKPSVLPVHAKVNNFILYSTYEMEVEYEIAFPIRFIFQDDYYKLKFSARSELPAVDSAEFIRNTDMVIDYAQHSPGGVKVCEAISKGVEKLNELLSKVGE